MELQEYSKLIKRTLHNLDSLRDNNLHMALGLVDEVGEVVKLFKKELAYGKEVDKKQLEEEIGDLMWFLVNLADFNDIDLEEAMQKNIDKLKKRYAEKFTSEEALDRDTDNEQKVF